MSDYYQRLIQHNSLVPFRIHGYASSHWCNYQITGDTRSIKQFTVSVYANTPHEAIFYADRLKSYIEQNPMINEYIGYPDDISIGTKHPVLDQLSSAYRVDMVLMTGALIM